MVRGKLRTKSSYVILTAKALQGFLVDVNMLFMTGDIAGCNFLTDLW